MGVFYLLLGPSACGKTTVERELVRQVPGMWAVVSHTTRPPRRGEIAGTSYHFINRSEFERMYAAGAFIETNDFPKNLPVEQRNWYALSLAEVDTKLALGDCVTVVEGHGAMQLMKHYPCRVLFFDPPSPSELERRMAERGDPPARIGERLGSMSQEMKFRNLADHVLDASMPLADLIDAAIAVCRPFKPDPEPIV